jgi:hypothetical protein
VERTAGTAIKSENRLLFWIFEMIEGGIKDRASSRQEDKKEILEELEQHSLYLVKMFKADIDKLHEEIAKTLETETIKFCTKCKIYYGRNSREYPSFVH